MENAAATITAYSVHPSCSTEKAILNSESESSGDPYAAAWCADSVNPSGQWLQVDLNSLTSVAGVITQGRGEDRYSISQWVTSYKLALSSDGVVWETYSEYGQEKVFAGNTDKNTEVEHLLDPPVTARFVRFYPQTVYGHPSMRMEVLLCAPATTTTETATTTTPGVTTTTPAETTTTHAVTTTMPAFATTMTAFATTTPAITTTMSVNTTTITTSGDAYIETTAMSGEATLTTSPPGEGGSAAANKGEARGGAVAGGVVGAIMAVAGAGLAVGGFLMYKKKKNNVTVEPAP
ncbi:PREDICTED: adipocyte enhancer-binding protein 1-like [Branchiostoma belcheri]|uniref:Adipocyte enhancer-binding protein 1-like n=1 Tax=Branchiostoma belcheri TaxID=7741 RepID=A0A6P4XX67_BRABE|nr:PREDICTED: adipocyte enhancer-binding protein 1-like [Branchiostoma belcheri]